MLAYTYIDPTRPYVPLLAYIPTLEGAQLSPTGRRTTKSQQFLIKSNTYTSIMMLWCRCRPMVKSEMDHPRAHIRFEVSRPAGVEAPTHVHWKTSVRSNVQLIAVKTIIQFQCWRNEFG